MDITKTIYVNAGVKTIYNAVATEQGIKGWWCSNCEVSEKIGGISKMTFHPGGKHFEMKFMVDGLLPDKLVIWRCIGNTNPKWLATKVSFAISGSDDRTELKFTHSDFPVGYDNKMESTNWGKFINSLKSFCETGTGTPMG